MAKSRRHPFTLTGARRAAQIAKELGCDLVIDAHSGEFRFSTGKDGPVPPVDNRKGNRPQHRKPAARAA
jgi:hypothetical protein